MGIRVTGQDQATKPSTYPNAWRYVHTQNIFARFHLGPTLPFLSKYSSKSAIGSMVHYTNRLSFSIWKHGSSSVCRIIPRATPVRRRYCHNFLPCYCKCSQSPYKCFPKNTTDSWHNSILAKRISITSAQPTVIRPASLPVYYRQAARHSLGSNNGF